MSFTMKVVLDLSSLYNMINEHQEVILFPLGGEGNNLVELFRYMGFLETHRICCIATSKLPHENFRFFWYSVPQLQLDDLPHMRETSMFIIAAPPSQREPAYQYLLQFGCKNVFLISDAVQGEINNALQNIRNSGQFLAYMLENLQRKINELGERIDEQNEVCAVNSKLFEPFRNKFRGKKVVLVATGPSLEHYKPIPDAIHIGVNFAWRRDDLQLNYLFTNDGGTKSVREQLQEGFDKISHDVFVAKLVNRIVWNWSTFPEEVSLTYKNAHRFYIEDTPESPIYQDICHHPLTQDASMVFPAMHFALFTYPKEIYLVGCDASSKYVHFYDHSQPNPIDFPGLERIKVTWARMKIHARIHYPETEIISINPVGLKGLFRDVYTDDFKSEPS